MTLSQRIWVSLSLVVVAVAAGLLGYSMATPEPVEVRDGQADFDRGMKAGQEYEAFFTGQVQAQLDECLSGENK